MEKDKTLKLFSIYALQPSKLKYMEKDKTLKLFSMYALHRTKTNENTTRIPNNMTERNYIQLIFLRVLIKYF